MLLPRAVDMGVGDLLLGRDLEDASCGRSVPAFTVKDNATRQYDPYPMA